MCSATGGLSLPNGIIRHARRSSARSYLLVGPPFSSSFDLLRAHLDVRSSCNSPLLSSKLTSAAALAVMRSPPGSTKITPASDRGLAGRIRSGIAYSSSKRARAAKAPERFRRSSCADHDTGPWPRKHGQFRSDMIARIRIEPLCQCVRGQS